MFLNLNLKCIDLLKKDDLHEIKLLYKNNPHIDLFHSDFISVLLEYCSISTIKWFLENDKEIFQGNSSELIYLCNNNINIIKWFVDKFPYYLNNINNLESALIIVLKKKIIQFFYLINCQNSKKYKRFSLKEAIRLNNTEIIDFFFKIKNLCLI